MSEREIERIDFASWLPAQTLFPKFYWKCRKTGVETVALGSCEEFFHIPRSPKDKLYGALSFPSLQKDPLWDDFPSPFFFLPEVEIVQSSEKTILTYKGLTPSFESLLKDTSFPSLGERVDFPDFAAWKESIESALAMIERKEIQKIVLARRSSFPIDSSSFSWLRHLIESSQNSTVFAFQRKPSSLFLGATPEMLYQRSERALVSESIAGTRRRGSSLEEDSAIGALLQKSSKDGREISLVKDFLSASFKTLCSKSSFVAKDSLIKTSHLIHLYNSLEGTLKPGVEDADILSSLHPTPAVGAFPKTPGLEKIHLLELFDRGLYAGALGWISPAESSFAVAIRSAIIKSNFLHAFAGTGIVEGSDPKQEWNELNHKTSHWNPLCLT